MTKPNTPSPSNTQRSGVTGSTTTACSASVTRSWMQHHKAPFPHGRLFHGPCPTNTHQPAHGLPPTPVLPRVQWGSGRRLATASLRGRACTTWHGTISTHRTCGGWHSMVMLVDLWGTSAAARRTVREDGSCNHSVFEAAARALATRCSKANTGSESVSTGGKVAYITAAAPHSMQLQQQQLPPTTALCCRL